MLDSILTSGLTLPTFLICTAASLILGLLTALVCMYRQRCSRGFAVTLAILPAMVQMVILLVNGNIGAGVAVALSSRTRTPRRICNEEKTIIRRRMFRLC